MLRVGSSHSCRTGRWGHDSRAWSSRVQPPSPDAECPKSWALSRLNFSKGVLVLTSPPVFVCVCACGMCVCRCVCVRACAGKVLVFSFTASAQLLQLHTQPRPR